MSDVCMDEPCCDRWRKELFIMLRTLLGMKKTVSTTHAPATADMTVDGLEPRRMMAASNLQVLGVRISRISDPDGTPLNSSRITVSFGRNGAPSAIRLGDASRIRNFGYATDLLSENGQRRVRVRFTASITGSGVLTLVSDRLIRRNSRLLILEGALRDRRGNDIIRNGSTRASTITLRGGVSKARFTLAQRGWTPSDLSYFSRDVFAAAPVPTTASTQPSSTTIRTNLVAYFDAKVARGLITADQRTSALALYDSTATAGIVPDANLRAALVSLTGTVAEPAISSVLNRQNVTNRNWSSITFSSSISADAPTGETKISSTGRLYTYIRPTYAGEPFQVLAGIVAREVMRQDSAGDSNGNLPDSQDESIVLSTVETVVYAQNVLLQPVVAGNGTLLINRANERLLALLNSGDRAFPYGGIFQAPNRNSTGNVFNGAITNPGGYGNNTPVRSFEDWIRREYAFRNFAAGATNSNPTSRAILQNIVGTTGNFTLFGTEVEGYLDSRNNILTDVRYIALGQALRLTF
jgi:hypothetical protein